MGTKRKPTDPAPATQAAPAAAQPAPAPAAAPPKATRKDQILSLYRSGITEVNDLAAITQSRASYVASVLQEAGGGGAYFDLYTPTSQPMNIYSKFFAGKMSYKDVGAARQSVALIDTLYRQFDLAGDRAGQHHALLMALTMFDRARWTNKPAEAEVFGAWLRQRLDEAAAPAIPSTPARSVPAAAPRSVKAKK
jgi:hypothetical protein